MKWTSIILCGLLLLACSAKPEEKPPKIQEFIVKAQNLTTKLNFTGTIQPLAQSPIVAPMDGIIEKMPQHFGEFIAKNNTVFLINSAELQKLYNDTLTEFLKTKENFSITQAKFQGSKSLWEAGLIAKNNYLAEKLSLNEARVSLVQAKHKLIELVAKTSAHDASELLHLSFADFKQISNILNKQHQFIDLTSKTSGILLYPPKGSDDKAGEGLTVGSTVKAGQVLGLIGNIEGLRIEIAVPEVDLNKLKLGMSALIRGVGFPGEILHGQLVSINSQASNSISGSLPSFMAVVEVPHLSLNAQKIIKIGMSANIELITETKNALIIPIASVINLTNQTLVQLKDKKDPITIHTGLTQNGMVIVESGLKAGDIIVYG